MLFFRQFFLGIVIITVGIVIGFCIALDAWFTFIAHAPLIADLVSFPTMGGDLLLVFLIIGYFKARLTLEDTPLASLEFRKGVLRDAKSLMRKLGYPLLICFLVFYPLIFILGRFIGEDYVFILIGIFMGILFPGLALLMVRETINRRIKVLLSDYRRQEGSDASVRQWGAELWLSNYFLNRFCENLKLRFPSSPPQKFSWPKVPEEFAIQHSELYQIYRDLKIPILGVCHLCWRPIAANIPRLEQYRVCLLGDTTHLQFYLDANNPQLLIEVYPRLLDIRNAQSKPSRVRIYVNLVCLAVLIGSVVALSALLPWVLVVVIGICCMVPYMGIWFGSSRLTSKIKLAQKIPQILRAASFDEKIFQEIQSRNAAKRY